MTQHKGFILAGCYIRLRKPSRINCYHATICHIFTRDCPFAFRSLSLRPMGGKIKLGPARTAFRDGLVEGESRGDCAPDCKPVRYCRRPVTPLPSPRRRSLEVAMITVMPAPQLPAARAGR